MTDTELNEKLNNDFKAFRMEHDNRIAQKYVIKEAGKGLSEENFTPQEKNKLASLTGGADIDTSQFATKTELQTAINNATVDTSQFATKDELQTAINNVTIDTSQFATKDELQTAISNVAIDSLSSNDVYIPAATYNDIMGKFNVATVSADTNLTEFLNIWTTNAFKKFQIKPTTPTPMGEYTAEDIYNAAINVSQASRALISDDLYVPQEDLADYFVSSHLEEVLQIMRSAISGTFITTAPCEALYSELSYTDKVITIKMADVFLQYLKANNIVPTIMYYTDGTTTYKITDDNLAWFNVIANGPFEKLTANNLADATELYACCRQTSELAKSDYISPDISVKDAENNYVKDMLFAVV